MAPQGNVFRPSYELEGEITGVFVEHCFHLKEQLANYGYSNLGIWQIFSQKWTKLAYNFKKNNWSFVANYKMNLLQIF